MGQRLPEVPSGHDARSRPSWAGAHRLLQVLDDDADDQRGARALLRAGAAGLRRRGPDGVVDGLLPGAVRLRTHGVVGEALGHLVLAGRGAAWHGCPVSAGWRRHPLGRREGHRGDPGVLRALGSEPPGRVTQVLEVAGTWHPHLVPEPGPDAARTHVGSARRWKWALKRRSKDAARGCWGGLRLSQTGQKAAACLSSRVEQLGGGGAGPRSRRLQVQVQVHAAINPLLPTQSSDSKRAKTSRKAGCARE